MKKARQIHKKQPKLTAKQTLEFLEGFSQLMSNKDAPTKLISIRVPENVLSAFKFKAEKMNIKYQSQIVKLIREWAASN